MDLQSGYPYPLIKNGLPREYPRLMQSLETDVAILGGGISGALIAYRLTEAGIPCTVLDARSIGLGSTCASTSLLQYELDTPLHELRKRLGHEAADRAYRLCAEYVNTLGKIAKAVGLRDFKFRKSVYYAEDEDDLSFLENEFSARRQAGLAVNLLYRDPLKRTYGFDAPAAIVSETAATTDAYLFTHALFDHVLRNGGQVYDRTRVTRIETGHGVRLVTENGCTVHAKKLVYATGYDTQHLPEKNLVTLSDTYACISEALPEEQPLWPDRAVLWNTACPYLYLRTTPDNRILVGGRDDTPSRPKRRDKRLAAKVRKLTGDFRTLFPHIPFEAEFSWAGTFASTADGLPYIGIHPRFPDRFFSLGYGGNGIVFSAIGADIICGMLTGKTPGHASLFSFHRQSVHYENT